MGSVGSTFRWLMVLKFCGVGYLLWLAVQMWRESDGGIGTTQPQHCLQTCTGRRQRAQVANLLTDGLTHKAHVEQHASALKLHAVGRHLCLRNR